MATTIPRSRSSSSCRPRRPASATSCRACSRRSSAKPEIRRPSSSRIAPAETACSPTTPSPGRRSTAHDADGQSRRPRDESASRQEPALRSVQELCADHPSGDGAQHPGGASFRAGELAQGADRLRQGQSRQAHLRLAGHRRVRPHRGGAAQAARRHRHRACAVPRRRAGGAGPRRRPCQHDVRRGVAGAAADPGRPGAALAVPPSSASRCCPTCRP